MVIPIKINNNNSKVDSLANNKIKIIMLSHLTCKISKLKAIVIILSLAVAKINNNSNKEDF